MFYNDFQVFLQLFQMHVSSILFAFRRMLQVLHLDVSKVDWVLHLPRRFLLPRLDTSSQRWLGIRRPSLHLLDASDIRDGVGPHGAGNGCMCGRPGRLDASEQTSVH